MSENDVAHFEGDEDLHFSGVEVEPFCHCDGLHSSE